VDFELTPQVEELRGRVRAFMAEHVYPVELEAMRALDAEVAPGTPYPEILVEIRAKAREEGLWNLFMPDERYGAGLGNW
jgi:acyl-CoA dehydrogenase